MNRTEACKHFVSGRLLRHKTFDSFFDYVSKEAHHGCYHETTQWFLNYYKDPVFASGWSVYKDKGLKETPFKNLFQTNKGVITKSDNKYTFKRYMKPFRLKDLEESNAMLVLPVSTFTWEEDSVLDFFSSEVIKVILYE